MRGADGTVTGVIGGVESGRAAPAAPPGPISVTLERKSVQTLADGTHITRVTHEIFTRDSNGRTRTENEFAGMAATGVQSRNIMVNDPVAGVNYSWQTGLPGGRKTYTKWQRPAPSAPKTGSDQLLHTLPDPANAAQTKSAITGQGSMTAQVGTPFPPSVAAAPPDARVVDRSLRPETTRDPLGQRIIGGLTCMAQRTTTVYPVDSFGNDRPITTVDETCMSQEAGRVIEETREDPRTGVQTVTLVSASTAEPDAALFQPPPDYTEMPQGRPAQQR